MFKAKVKPEPVQTKKLQKSDKKSRSKTAGLPIKEDLLLQMKHLKLDDESNIQTLIKNIQSMKKESRRMEMSSPLTGKRGDLDKIEIEEDEKIMGNDEIYDMMYGPCYEKQIYHDEPELKSVLEKSEIRDGLRAKMVDWMIEVFANYSDTSQIQTYFKAVTIMDLYFKHSKMMLRDSDVHLSGVAAMFLATKYEDIYHIPLRDFLTRVAHNKFKGLEIKSKEWDIMTVLNFDISFPTYYNFFERFFWKSFNADVNSNYIRSIEETGVYILRMVLYSVTLLKYRPHILGISVLLLAVHTLFEELMSKNKAHKEVLKVQEKEISDGIYSVNPNINIEEVDKCCFEIGNFINNFENLYPGLMNYQKFQLEIIR